MVEHLTDMYEVLGLILITVKMKQNIQNTVFISMVIFVQVRKSFESFKELRQQAKIALIFFFSLSHHLLIR